MSISINEARDGKTFWISENITELREEFIAENLNEFNEFMEEQIVDEDRTFDYWKMQFCEENKGDFDGYCESTYEDL